MFNIDHLISQIKSCGGNNFLFFNHLTFEGLEKFIVPETDLLSLVMLSAAYQQGLDIGLVDKVKFFNGSFKWISGERNDEQENIEGTRIYEYQLSPVLLHDAQFSLKEYPYLDGNGFINQTENLIHTLINHNLRGIGEFYRGDWVDWVDGYLMNIQQLYGFINHVLTQSPPFKQPWYIKRPLGLGILLFIGSIFVIIGIGIYYVFKSFKQFFGYVKRLFIQKA